MHFIWALLATTVSCDVIFKRQLLDEPIDQLRSPEALEIVTTMVSESLIKENSDVDTMDMKAEDALKPSADAPADSIENLKEKEPPFSRALWDTNHKICLLAEFKATFTINYDAQGREQVASIILPEDAKVTGRCAYQHPEPLLGLTWEGFRFTLTFSKLPEPKSDTWVVTSMELMYNTNAVEFIGVNSGGVKTARTAENITWFSTPESKSFYCPAPNVIDMYNTKKEKVVTATFQEIRLQPFELSKGKFSPANRCSAVRIGSQLVDQFFEQDETVPVAVGSTLAAAAILTVVGYAFYKSYVLKRVDYNTMD